MGVSASRRFGSVEKLKTFDPDVMCEALRKFPVDLLRDGIALPEQPDCDNMPYEAIVSLLLSKDLSGELDDLLFYVSVLGSESGWEHVVKEAERCRYSVDTRSDGRSFAGCVIGAWLKNWPDNKGLLEKSYARTQIYSLTAYAYFPMVADVREKCRSPGDGDIKRFESELARYFESKGHGRGTRVHVYEFDDEIWFLIRYPGRLEFVPTLSEEGDGVQKLQPAKFDALVYDKRHGFLRMNTRHKGDQSKYRIEAGHLLFGMSNVFRTQSDCVTLDPLLGESAGIFNCGDMACIRDIVLVEVSFTDLLAPGKLVSWKWEGGEEASLDRMPYVQFEGGKTVNYPLHVLPTTADNVRKAKFRYTLRNSGGRSETLEIREGNQLRYARDSDAARIGEWLISRGFVRGALGVARMWDGRKERSA